MKLNQANLFTMAKVAGIIAPLPDEEQHKGPPGKAFVEKAKALGGQAVGAGAMVYGGIAALGKPQPPKDMDPRY